MVFGKIDYLNLLPFHTFMKRFTKSSQQSLSMHYKRGVPSKINSEFLHRRVDAAFISSIKAKKQKHLNLGIIAKKEVLSVLVVPNTQTLSDNESASSNILAQVLNIQGQVLIGDKALRHYLEQKPSIDLAQEWYKRYNKPFVFALLCYHSKTKTFHSIEKEFLKKPVKSPQYILHQASQRTQISPKDILHYLTFISYDLDTKAKQGLKQYYKLTGN